MSAWRLATLLIVLSTCSLSAQTAPPAAKPAPNDDAVAQLRSELSATQTQLGECLQQIDGLRKQLQELQARLPAATNGSTPAGPAYPTIGIVQATPPNQPLAADVQPQDEERELLAGKVDELEQTKVESASRYKVKLSGLILLNSFSNSGTVDVTDLPNLAFQRAPGQPRGDIGATLRQTLLGVDVNGPELFGGRTSAAAQIDFFGGFPQMNYGVTAGLLRLRTATARIDWHNSSLLVGQDAAFISPRSPTSYATLAEPAFSWSGNLWVWTPQVVYERRWAASDRSHFSWRAGLLDPLTEDVPEQFNRTASAGERSRVPAFATRVAWSGMLGEREIGAGGGVYFGHQSYGFGRDVNSWAATADWTLPVAPRLELSGELYRGKAIGGLGAGVWQSVVFSGLPDLAASVVSGLNDLGGWSQLKFRASRQIEMNAAFGLANLFSRDLQRFAQPQTEYEPLLPRNHAGFVNTIWRPRSNLLLALEYRRLETFSLADRKNTADHVNLALGVSF